MELHGALRTHTCCMELHGTFLLLLSSSHLLHGQRLEDAEHGETKHDVNAGRGHFDRGDAWGEGGGDY